MEEAQVPTTWASHTPLTGQSQQGECTRVTTTRETPTVPSDWKVRQYASITSQRSWSYRCSVCGDADGTDSKQAALDLARGHMMAKHPELCR